MNKDIVNLVITAVVAPSIALIIKGFFDIKGKHIEVETPKTSPLELSLTEHPFFERMKCLRTHIQYSFELQNKGKQEVFKDILLNKFNITINEYWDMVNDIEEKKDKLNEVELYNLIVDHVREGLKKSQTYYLLRQYTAEEQKCLAITLRKFNKWHSPRIDGLFQSIEMVCNSKFYSGIIVKSSIVLDILIGAFVDILNDSESAFDSMNGDLHGLTFHGIPL